MEDRKLYHLVNGEFVLNGMPSVQTVPTYEEINTHIAILRNVGFFDDPVAESVTFDGIGNGKRSDAIMAEIYDAIHAEILGEHMAEKELRRKHHNAEMYAKAQSQKYRNRSGKKREELPKCNMRGHDADRGYWKNWRAYCEFKSRTEWKQNDRERSLRSDWKTELCALTEEIECAEFMLESDNEDLEWLNNEIENIGNVDGVIALYEKRIKQLRKSSERKGKLEQYKADTEKRIRNGKEYMRKYNYVREMI